MTYKPKTEKLLLDSKQVISVQRALVQAIGLSEAITLQQIHFWIDNNTQSGKRIYKRQGIVWCWNTWNEWKKGNFPWWSTTTIRRVFRSLEERGLIVMQPHENKNDGMWVTVNYGAVELLLDEDGEPVRVRRPKSETTKVMPNWNDSHAKLEGQSLQVGMPARDTKNTENTKEKISAASAAASVTDTDKASISLVPKDEPVTKTGKTAIELEAWRNAVCDALGMPRTLPVGMINNYLCLLCHITEPKNKKSEWLVCRLNKPLASIADVQAFGKYVKRRADEQRIKPPTTPETIARWATEFQAQAVRPPSWQSQPAVE